MTSKEFARLVGHAVQQAQAEREQVARQFLTVDDTPQQVAFARDFNREYDIAPWSYDD